MIKFKNTKLSKKEIKTLNIVLDELPDSFRDFYTTQNNIRLFLQDNKELISNAVAKGDYLIYDTEEKGLLLVTGYLVVLLKNLIHQLLFMVLMMKLMTLFIFMMDLKFIPVK